MRNFRKAALAGATAVALTFGSASVAAAEEADTNSTSSALSSSSTDENEGTTGPSLSSKIGKRLGAVDKEGNPNGLDGRDLFGSSKENWDDIALWAKLLYVTTIFTSVSAIVGLIVGPAYNFFVHGPFAA